MKFEERLELCVDEILGDILTKGMAQNKDYQRLKSEEKHLSETLDKATLDDLQATLENYKCVLHQIALIELRCVYKEGVRHGIKIKDFFYDKMTE